MTIQETDLDVPRSVQESLAKHGLTVACCEVKGIENSSEGISPFEGGCLERRQELN